VEPCERQEQQRLADLLGYPVCAILPNEYLLVSAAANNGRMAVDIKPGSPLTRNIDLLTAQICDSQKVG
jgi:pilus assembly protein CpaE